MAKTIVVTQRSGQVHNIIVDDDFKYDRKIGYDRQYAYLHINLKKIYLHRYITGASEGEFVDHINRNKLDNRKENLRIVTRKQNQQNIDRKGYSLEKRTGRYRVSLKIDGAQTSIGYYDTKEEAREVYKREHAKQYGEFSPYWRCSS
ncbi:HNH endonuclease [Bacillus toyonensis]|uniref:HNH endonuclease n=1 Tax=Bacillus toyonensis TaxID=155322 RepID=UPI00124DC23E|nr:HNH endonuclease [Bacillus toyonensis]KAB2380198.1 hypothetical protein F8507_27315 [Bacillus toyonensis]